MSGAPRMQYVERAPSAAIAPWVLTLWGFRADELPPPGAPYAVWPDGCLNVGVFRHERFEMLVGTGPRVVASHPPVTPGARLWGVRFWPDAVGPALGIAPRTLRDHMGPAPGPVAAWFATMPAAVPRTEDAELALDALDRWLAERLRGAAAPDERIRAAVRAIVAARGDIAMDAVARAAALGLRQLQRRFPDATGLTLREWARVRRLREALAGQLAPDPRTWSRIAAESGFADQAHLTREFVALTGLAPGAAGRFLRSIAHEDVTP